MSAEQHVITYISSVIYLILSYFASIGFAGWFKAFMCRKMGDDTASLLGKETVDPFVHIDPIGFVCLLIFGFGWGNLIPFDFDAFQGPWSRVKMVVAYYSDVFMHLLLATSSVFVLAVVSYAFDQCGLLNSSYGTVAQLLVQSFFSLNLFIATIRIISYTFSLAMRWWIGSQEIADNSMVFYLMLLGPIILFYVYGKYVQYACHYFIIFMCRILFWFLG